MNIDEDKEVDVAVKNLEQSMSTYRYLADMNVKYVMFFLIVCGFTLKIYVDSEESANWLILFLGATGAYSSNSIYLVFKRMQGLAQRISSIEASLNIEANDFVPFLKFLNRTYLFVAITTIVIVLSMFFHHPTSGDARNHNNLNQSGTPQSGAPV